MKHAFDVDVAKACVGQRSRLTFKAAMANIQAAEASVRKVKADKKSAEATVTVARSTVDRLKTMMDYTVLRAPYDGVVTKADGGPRQLRTAGRK